MRTLARIVFLWLMVIGIIVPFAPPVTAQVPVDIVRIEARVDRVNERLQGVENQLGQILGPDGRLAVAEGQVKALYDAVYYSPQSSLTLRLNRIEDQVKEIREVGA